MEPGRVFPQVDSSDLVRHNATCNMHVFFNVQQLNWDNSVTESTILQDSLITPDHTDSPASSSQHKVYPTHPNSLSDRDETLHMDYESDASASEADANDVVDPNSLAAMERSQSPAIDDQREASPILEGPEVGVYEDIGAPLEYKIHELQIAQQFINSLKNATLDNSKLDDWV